MMRIERLRYRPLQRRWPASASAGESLSPKPTKGSTSRSSNIVCAALSSGEDVPSRTPRPLVRPARPLDRPAWTSRCSRQRPASTANSSLAPQIADSSALVQAAAVLGPGFAARPTLPLRLPRRRRAFQICFSFTFYHFGVDKVFQGSFCCVFH